MSAGAATVKVVGRYAIYQAIASGGMATVFLGRLVGPVGFARTVAIKRLHPQYAGDPKFVSMFLDEGRLAARVRHPNVVPTLDVVATNGELFLVMEYVHGESLGKLLRAAAEHRTPIPVPIVVAIMSGVLQGLEAAHEAKSERGVPLQIIHRDVSPQNILLGRDGQARLLDFGVARADERLHTTQEGVVKGKVSYMAPEHLRGEETGPETDVYAACAVMWEALTGQGLFRGESHGALLVQVLESKVDAPSEALRAAGDVDRAMEVGALDAIVMRGLARTKSERWQTAREVARALEAAIVPATASQVSDWVESAAGKVLRERASMVAEIESSSAVELTQSDLGVVLDKNEARNDWPAASIAQDRRPSTVPPPMTSKPTRADEVPFTREMSTAPLPRHSPGPATVAPATAVDPQPSTLPRETLPVTTLPLATTRDATRPLAEAPLPMSAPRAPLEPAPPAADAPRAPSSPPGPLPGTLLSVQSPVAGPGKDLRDLSGLTRTLQSASSPVKPGTTPPPSPDRRVSLVEIAPLTPTVAALRKSAAPAAAPTGPARMRPRSLKVLAGVVLVTGIAGGAYAAYVESTPAAVPGKATDGSGLQIHTSAPRTVFEPSEPPGKPAQK